MRFVSKTGIVAIESILYLDSLRSRLPSASCFYGVTRGENFVTVADLEEITVFDWINRVTGIAIE